MRRQNVTTMDETDFEAERARLRAIATRILGSSADADDMVQEAWLRLDGAQQDGGVDEPAAFLTTVVTRLCLDQLRRRRTRSAAEAAAPIEAAPVDPERDVEVAERVGEAMYVVLDSLRPAERVAFVMHDVFGYPFEDIADALGRSPAAVRQLASRGRRRAQDDATVERDRARHNEIVGAFLTAARGGDLSTLLTLLAPDVVMRADAFGRQMGTEAAYDGPAAVAARFNGARGALPVTIDGYAGAAWILHREVKVAFAFTLEDGLISSIELIADPDVLGSLDVDTARRRS